MADDTVMKVEQLSKEFILPHQRVSTIKSRVVSLFQRFDKEKQVALDDISFEIKQGEFFGIVGRNGSGKSTLLKCMAGVYTPNRGKIHVKGKLVPFIELGVGFNPELSGRDNVYLNGAILGFGRKEVDKMYDEIVAFAELEEFMDQALKNYSSGMQVRLAFSIAIRAEGDILLLDEVLAVGDSAFQRKCLDYFRQIKTTDKTIILVSHSMPMVEEFCDRAMMIEDSRIVAIGNPLKISAEYEMANSVFSTKGLFNKDRDKSKIKNRPENPDIKITEVAVLSNQGKTTDFGLKDEVNVEVHLHATKGMPAMLSMVLHNVDGEYIAGLNTRQDLPDLVLKPGDSTLNCRIAPGQFPNGPYQLTVNVMSAPKDKELTGEIIDVASHEFGVKLPVITFTEKSDFKKGKFYMAANWQLKS